MATQGEFIQPDLVLGLNAGLHEQPLSHTAANTWLPTLRLLVDKSIPAVFTSFTHGAHLVRRVRVVCVSCARCVVYQRFACVSLWCVAEEWQKDAEVARRAQAKITRPGQPNPWRSLQPLQEMEAANTFFYLNHIMWAFEGRQPQ
jgi:hypothetical protein